jgi:hypothetical protein
MFSPLFANLMKPTQPLHQHDRRLRHDSDRFHGNYQQNDRDEPEKHEGQKSVLLVPLVAPSEIGGGLYIGISASGG